METVEKLMVQILERKRWKEQLKLHKILYDEYLATKCLVDGIAPPPWLWSSSFQPQTSDPIELRKEEFISDLLLTLPQPAAYNTCSRRVLCEVPTVTTDNEGSCMKVPSFREGDGLPVVPQIPDIDAGCASNGAPDQDPIVMSPEEFRDSRIPENYNDTALSLERLQRSKSRQRALELRNSSRATKSNPCDERGVGSLASQIDELDLAKYAGVAFRSHVLEEEGTGQYNEDSIGAHDSQIALQYEHPDGSDHVNHVDVEGRNDENNVGAPNHELSLQNNHDALGLENPVSTGDESCREDEAKAGPRDENGFDPSASAINPRPDNVEGLEIMKPVDCFIEHCTTKEVKVGEHNKNNNAVCSSQNMTKLEHIGIFDATEPVNVCRESFASGEKRKEGDGDMYSSKVKRLRSSGGSPGDAKEPIDACNSSSTIKEYGSKLMEYVGKLPQQPNHTGELTDLVNPSILTNESCGARKVKVSDSRASGKQSSVYSGRVMRSSSSMQQFNHMSELLRLDGSCDCGKEDSFQKSIQKPCEVVEMLELAKPFNVVDGACGRMMRSKSSFGSLNSVDWFPKLNSSSHVAYSDQNMQVNDVLQVNVSKSLISEMKKNVECRLSDRAESSYQRQAKTDEHGLEAKDEILHASFALMHENLGQSLVSGSTELPNGYSSDSLLEDTKVADPTDVISDALRELKNEEIQLGLHVGDQLEHGNKKNTIATKNSMERETLLPQNDKSLSHAVDSSCIKAIDLIGTDQIMPEFEGFIVQTFDEESPHSKEGISIDKLDVRTTTLNSVSILEQLSKSTCLHTSASELSATSNLNRATNLTQSILSGLLQGIDQRSTSIDGDTSIQLKTSNSSMAKDANQAGHGEFESSYLPFSGAQSTWDIRRPSSSPRAKLWNGFTLKSGSSEKQGSLSIELPCISEENENVDEVADPSEEAFATEVAGTSVRREPLADIAVNLNAPAAVSEAENFLDRCSLDSVHTGFSFAGAFNSANQTCWNCDSGKRRYGNNAKENQNVVRGANGLRRASESLNKVFSEPKLPGQTNLGKGGLSFSKRDSKYNNIVSNITTFIPLVQQKQPAGIIPGKRDVKVKALEAAEGAKRLAEKKENERRMKKEALKLERARVEQENLRQLELQKKMKEEERKKKGDDMAARKRQREEDEMKEKERKRRRAVEAQRQQQDRVENLRIKKEDKQKKFENKDERAPYKKKPDNDSRKLEKREVQAHNKSQAEPRNARTTRSDARKAKLEECELTSGSGYDAKVLNDVGQVSENDKWITSIGYEESYDISPFKGSDDEDDDLPNGKFIPSWASEHNMALIGSSLQRVNPEEIFPPETFCNIAEVLLPRKCTLS